VELFEQIRKDRRAGGVSVRELAGRHHVHRRTVRQALASAVPPPRKPVEIPVLPRRDNLPGDEQRRSGTSSAPSAPLSALALFRGHGG
jgi:hypothetical protein